MPSELRNKWYIGKRGHEDEEKQRADHCAKDEH